MSTLTSFDQTIRLDRMPLRSTTCRRQTRRQLSRAQRCDTQLDTWLDINGRWTRSTHLSLASNVGFGGRLRQMVFARRTTVAYQLESIPHISVTSHSVVEFECLTVFTCSHYALDVSGYLGPPNRNFDSLEALRNALMTLVDTVQHLRSQ